MPGGGGQRNGHASPAAVADASRLTLALVEAQVGPLVELLPVALLVTSASGEILRANHVATELLGQRGPLEGRQVTDVLPFLVGTEADTDERQTIRGAVLTEVGDIHALDVRLRRLRHDGDVLRLYVLNEV
jgi:hypothetical protein